MERGVFDYDLPAERIAQWPAGRTGNRDEAKLLVATLAAQEVRMRDDTFSSLPSLLQARDLLILNDSEVVPSRFFAVHERSGREVEILLLRRTATDEENGAGHTCFEALARPMRKLQPDDKLLLSESLTARVVGRSKAGNRVLLTVSSCQEGSDPAVSEELIERDALMPIPPYIRGGRAEEIDREYYQTVFAEKRGSVAAPTAGLHFTQSLLKALQEQGVHYSFLTLHVSASSFIPVRGENGAPASMGSEFYSIPDETRQAIAATREAGGRVVAVGTTCVRALESFYGEQSLVSARERYVDTSDGQMLETSIFIQPGHEFRVVDALITNFHQPRSTHLVLVSAFFGELAVRRIYEHALRSDYRFLSYGDAMFLEKEDVEPRRGRGAD